MNLDHSLLCPEACKMYLVDISMSLQHGGCKHDLFSWETMCKFMQGSYSGCKLDDANSCCCISNRLLPPPAPTVMLAPIHPNADGSQCKGLSSNARIEIVPSHWRMMYTLLALCNSDVLPVDHLHLHMCMHTCIYILVLFAHSSCPYASTCTHTYTQEIQRSMRTYGHIRLHLYV